MRINKKDLTYIIHAYGYQLFYKGVVIREVNQKNDSLKASYKFYLTSIEEFIDMILTGRNLPLWLVFQIDEIDKIENPKIQILPKPKSENLKN